MCIYIYVYIHIHIYKYIIKNSSIKLVFRVMIQSMHPHNVTK